jgi:hypothetical protein
VLRGAGGEGIGGLHDAGDHLAGRKAGTGARSRDQSRFPPFFFGGVFGFAYAVREENQQIARLKLDLILDVARHAERAYRRTARLQQQYLAATKHHRRIVAAVGIHQPRVAGSNCP